MTSQESIEMREMRLESTLPPPIEKKKLGADNSVHEVMISNTNFNCINYKIYVKCPRTLLKDNEIQREL